MAINKTVNKSSKSHGAMRNCIEYVLREQKTTDGYVYMTGPAPDTLTWDSVYNAFLEEKKIWNKDNGRMYSHNIISFHKDEAITHEEALDFGKAFAEEWFPGNQTLIAVHQDKDHVHIHLVTNTVSYETGRKLHNTRKDLQQMKDFTNEMCKKRKLAIAQKGYHFDGSRMELGEMVAWSKDKYKLLTDDRKKSHLVDCATAVVESLQNCLSREAFIRNMESHGWQTVWSEKRKYITFINGDGKKIRDSNISKTFSMNINKEALLHEFERQNESRLAGTIGGRDRRGNLDSPALDRYYEEVAAAVGGTGTDRKSVQGNKEADKGAGVPEKIRPEGRPGEDTATLIRSVRSEIAVNRSENRNVVNAEDKSKSVARKREIERKRKAAIKKRAKKAERAKSRAKGYER